MLLGDRIKDLRKRKGIQQETLAEELNINVTTVSGWENNKSMPRSELLARLSEILGISIDYLFFGDDAMRRDKVKEYIEEATVNKRGELKYTFANGDKLEIPDTPEGRALFERMVFKNSSPETCLKKQ